MHQVVGKKLLYILRLALGITVGVICGVLGITGIAGVLLAVVVYIPLHLLGKKTSLSSTEGLIEYIGLWLSTWCLVYTMLYVHSGT
ncbi:MAG: hypothetical protein DRJ49_00490 [Thermoprotei archaeon]|nr:MAG: hypothetical protein DRN53_06695 [Thermoprotei archaeon]RLE90183.1 MAG: hypothetical protein DRJ49_00490 [Thermoprotei archaeon]